MSIPSALKRSFALSCALLVSFTSFAAEAKHNKPKRVAAPAADSAPRPPAPAESTDSARADLAPVAVGATAGSEAEASQAGTLTTEPLQSASITQTTESPPPQSPPRTLVSEPNTSDVHAREYERLGREEAARIAAGRIEVGAWASAGVGSRHFKYSDPLGRLLAPYRLPAAPLASFGLEAYPFAASNVPGLRDFGFRSSFSRAFAVDSRTPDGSAIETSWTRFAGELRERVLLPGPHAFELGIHTGLDASYFVLNTQSKVAALLPSARTIALSFGLDARLLVSGRFSLLLGGAYLLATSRGAIYDRFRNARLGGVDGNLGAALSLVPGLEAQLSGRYTRYFATFHPHVGDAAVAGGALDEQLQVGLGVRYAH